MHFIKYSILILSLLVCIPFASAEFTGHTINSADGVPISYRVQGEGEPALVFVHGWVSNQEFWKAQRKFFAQTHKVVTLDLAGHGASGQERQNWSIEAFGEDLTAVITALDLQKTIVIGHAAGASVALEAARTMPDRIIGLVGVDSIQNVKLTSTIEGQNRILTRFREDYTGFATRVIRSMFSLDVGADLVEKVTQEMLTVPEDIGIATLQAAMAYPQGPAVQSLSIPIRCINSDAFPTNVQDNKAYAKSYEVVIVPGSKHFFFLESPDEFNEILGSVLEEITGYAAKEEAEEKPAE